MDIPGGIMDRWAEVENIELDRIMWSFYGPLLRLGCVFPSWTRKQRFKSVLIIAWNTFLYVYHVPLLVKSMILEVDNSHLFSLTLHHLLLILCVSFIIILCQVKRKTLATIHTIFMGDFFTYSTGSIYDEDAVKDIKKKLDMESMRAASFPIGLVAVLAVAIVTGPYYMNVSNDVAYSPSGVSLTLPVPAWYPFETHKGVAHVAAVTLQIALALSLGITCVGVLLLLYRVFQKIRYEYKVLDYSLRTLFDRAFRGYLNEHPACLLQGTDQFDDTYQYYIGLSLKDCIKHHHKISRTLRDFGELVSLAIAAVFLTGMAAIGLSLINILLSWSKADYATLAVFVTLLVSETLNMFILSALGEIITSASENLRDQLYSIDWPEFNLRNKKLMLIFHTIVTEPVVLKAGPIMEIRLDTFTSIMNSAYSVFNLLNI